MFLRSLLFQRFYQFLTSDEDRKIETRVGISNGYNAL